LMHQSNAKLNFSVAISMTTITNRNFKPVKRN
jgi:hypothetical protein